MLTLRSGMLNLWLAERLLVRVVAAIILSHVCWQVFSPGAEINQNSVMVTAQVPLAKTERRTVFRLQKHRACLFIYSTDLATIQAKELRLHASCLKLHFSSRKLPTDGVLIKCPDSLPLSELKK